MGRSPTPKLRPEAVPFHAPQGVHLALALVIPGTFCGLAAFWLAGEGPNVPQAINLVYAVLVSLWSSWRLRTKQGPWLRIWVWLMLSLACYGAQCALEALPWPHTFAFEGSHLLWFLLGLFQAQLGALWAGQLAARARLFQLTADVPDGRALELAVREYQLDADFSRSNKTVLSLSLIVLMTMAAVLASVSRYGGSLTPVLFVAFFLLCLLAGVLVRTYRREMESMMYGKRWSWGEKAAPLGWSLLLAALAGALSLAFLCIGPWSASFSMPDGNPSPTDTAADNEASVVSTSKGDVRLAVLAALLERILGVQNLLLAAALLVRAAAFAAPWVALVFLVWPLVRWVISGGFETRGLLGRWKGLIAAQWAAFVAALNVWWGRPRVEQHPPMGRPAVERWLRSFFRRAGPKPLMPELVEAFLKVAAWAEPLVTYRRGETTREFLDRLAAALPESAPLLATVRDALDNELFGPGLGAHEKASFHAAVTALTARPPFHDTTPEVS